MRRLAKGTFEVQLSSQQLESDMPGAHRVDFTKQFHGDLDGTSCGVMLTAGDPGQGEAGFVALEVYSGSFWDRSGTFALQQMGVAADGGQTLDYVVVSGSGTGGFTGMRGTLQVTLLLGDHGYELACEWPEP